MEVKDKTVFSIGSPKSLSGLTGGKYGYGKRRRLRGIFSKSLRFEDDDMTKGTERLHDVRILPKDFLFPGYIMIFDNKVAIILFEGNGFGYLIESYAFSKMARSIFEVLWKIAKPASLA